MTSTDRTATEKQIALMRELGVAVPETCSVEEAADLIVTARIIQRFAVQIARQEWRSDLAGLDLSSLVQAVMSTPGMAQQIHENMDASAQAAFSAKAELEKDARGKSNPIDPEALVGDVKEDASYYFVKMRLEKMFPNISSHRLPAQKTGHEMPKVFLAPEQSRWEKFRWWVRAWFY
jgi:hypothetical protein